MHPMAQTDKRMDMATLFSEMSSRAPMDPGHTNHFYRRVIWVIMVDVNIILLFTLCLSFFHPSIMEECIAPPHTWLG